MAQHWAVAVSKPCQEHKAVANLKMRGIESFMPLVEFRGRVEPAFPRYLFAAFESCFTGLLTVPGISDVVRVAGAPAVVPDREVAALKARCVDGVLCTTPRLQYGMRVRVERGALVDQVGKVLRMSSGRRVEVLFEFLGRFVSVKLDENDLTAA